MNIVQNQAIPVDHDGAVVDVVADIRPGGEDVVLLLHGLSSTKESFAGIIDSPALTHVTTCAIDLPGHGRTAPLRWGVHSLEAYADVVVRVLARLAPARLHVVGH